MCPCFASLTVILLAATSTMTDAPPTATTEPRPPRANRVPHVAELHGERRTDDWFWLRRKDDPEVRAYLEAENAYADEVMKPLEGFREALYAEMLGRIQQTDLSVPWRQGAFLYYARTEEGKQYPIWCRRPAEVPFPATTPPPGGDHDAGGGSASAAARPTVAGAPIAGATDPAEATLLDLNAIAESHAFVAIRDFEPSDDGARLAYGLDTTGFRQYVLRVRDLSTGRDLPDTREKVANLTWAADGRTLFYTVEDPAKRHWRLYRHRLGEPVERDAMVFEERDERFELSCHRTRSGAFLVLTSASQTTSEVRVLPADRPDAGWTLIAPRADGVEYYLDHRGDRFWIRVNDAGRNFRVVTAPVATPDRAHWREEVGHRPAVMVEGVDLFARHCVRWEREDGLPQVTIVDLATGTTSRLAFPESAWDVYPDKNEVFDTTLLRYGYTSFVTPRSVFDVDMNTRTPTLLKRQPVLGGYDPARYAVERLEAEAPDGTRVPISLVRRADVARDGRAPLYLYGYGAYGITMNVGFDARRLSLLDRGVIYAIAHVRGGGELGKPWHDGGRMASKPNTFSDFIACAEHLVRERYTTTDRLLIGGGSAGGLLVGAVLNQRPELFKAALVQVPFVDVLNSMSDETLPLTVTEFEEWGNPRVRADYEIMRRYCPYTNLAARDYPALLVKTSFHDSQVMYWEPAKYVAKLRTLKTDRHPLLFRTNMAGGHGGSSGRFDALRDTAFDYAFLLWQAGITK
jgi:oligopeptidase B